MEESAKQPKSAKAQPAALPGAFDLFGPSIQVLAGNLGTFIGLLLAPVAVFLIPAVLLGVAGGGNANSGIDIAGLLLGLIAMVFFIVAGVAMTVVQLKGAAGQKVSFGDALRQSKHFVWRYLGLGICMTVIFIVSLLLLIVPFFFALRRYFLAPYYLIDRDLKVFEALKASAADSKQYSGAIWGIIGVTVLINLAGLIPLLGWLASPVLSVLYFCAPAVRYHQINERTGKAAKKSVAPAAA